MFRVVRLGGPKVRKVRCNAVDLVDGRDVHMYRDWILDAALKVVYDFYR